jgi:DNA-binding SARP family transcriptional activator
METSPSGTVSSPDPTRRAIEVEFRILGPLAVWAGGRRLAHPGERSGALLALLLLNANRVVSIDHLIDELWGEDPPASGAKAVQVRVSQLRKAFVGAGVGEIILTRPFGYVIELGPDQLDLQKVEHLVSESDRALAAADTARGADLLREAIGLWRGTPLAEFSSAPFARTARARLEDLQLTVIERRIDADLALGRHSELVGELESLTSVHPYREGLRAQLMLALYRSGRQAEALAAYRAARQELLDGLGIEPSRSLQELERRILQQDERLAPAPPAGRGETGSSLWEEAPPERSILVATDDPAGLQGLLPVAEPLTRRPRRELILSALLENSAELAPATDELEAVRALLTKRGVSARIAAFTSRDRGVDLVRLVSEQDVDLLVLAAPVELLASGAPPADLAHIWRDAPCDVVVAAGLDEHLDEEKPLVVPFGGSNHDWAALEIGAWLASTHGAKLQLLGTAAAPELGKRDASRSLAVVSLVVQRTAGISATPVLVAPGEALLEVAKAAGLLLLGLSERWSREGLGSMRLGLAQKAGVPTLFVRRGLRPGGLTPPERMTRYTWSFLHAAGKEEN